jgi:hypothetical protein
MKKIITFLKNVILGILPTSLGALAGLGVYYIYHNVINITKGSGWTVVFYFILAFVEATLVILAMYALGETKSNSNKWIKHKQEVSEDTISGSSDDNETSDDAADS